MALNREQILDLLPHRPPFLWIDRVLELESGIRCVTTKYIDPAEPVFIGHFPGHPILPGALIIEAAAQTAAVMVGAKGNRNALDAPHEEGPGHRLAAVRSFRFFKPVYPGSELRIEATMASALDCLASIEARVWVEGQEIARGELFVFSPK
jgi:3-hydroxyacyl-[acyl-carrier-protein] dehydratase